MILGIDTSCYTTSLAIVGVDGGLITDRRRLLDIKKGKRGLAQSEMFFAHINNFPGLYQQALEDLDPAALLAICVSEKPRNAEGSYMPAFRGGHDLARVIAASLSLPLYTTSHQEGHLAAALWSLEDQSETLPCLSGIKDGEKFLALHLSGGTSEILLAQRLAGGFQTEILATADLAAGQFIDRIGVALGLDFPCGQALEKLALAEGKSSFQLPMSVQKTKFSFSGPESAAQRIIKQ
ncbi:MAG: O-sialoglycoprotein endopeptidase, partial [Clostridiales bacterium]